MTLSFGICQGESCGGMGEDKCQTKRRLEASSETNITHLPDIWNNEFTVTFFCSENILSAAFSKYYSHSVLCQLSCH